MWHSYKLDAPRFLNVHLYSLKHTHTHTLYFLILFAVNIPKALNMRSIRFCGSYYLLYILLFIFCFADDNNVYQFNFPCTRCNSRMYKHRASLNSHLKLECGVEPQFQCNACGRQFTWKQHLKRHMINVHKTLHL